MRVTDLYTFQRRVFQNEMELSVDEETLAYADFLKHNVYLFVYLSVYIHT